MKPSSSNSEPLKPVDRPLPLPPLPNLDGQLYAIHYSQALLQNSPAQTPPVSAIIVQHVLTYQQKVFSSFRVAEQLGIPTESIPNELLQLERKCLASFYEFLAETPNIVFLHWGMRGASFGFEVLEQRARVLDLQSVPVPDARRFDLVNYLKRFLGRDFVPHPRLENALRCNGKFGPEILSQAAAASAWKARDYAKLIQSLACKVDGIATLFERLCTHTFRVWDNNELTRDIPTYPDAKGSLTTDPNDRSAGGNPLGPALFRQPGLPRSVRQLAEEAGLFVGDQIRDKRFWIGSKNSCSDIGRTRITLLWRTSPRGNLGSSTFPRKCSIWLRN